MLLVSKSIVVCFFRQRVYGVTTALVKVGYEYSDCKDILWDVQTTKLSGHDMSISEVGGWNLDIHHRYNFHEGEITCSHLPKLSYGMTQLVPEH